ncbi:hypothetical protein JNUCC64_14440 [Streptomyces sp. JNUCC 64]
MTSASAAYPVLAPPTDATVVVSAGPATAAVAGRTVAAGTVAPGAARAPERRAAPDGFSPHLYGGLGAALCAVGGLLVATVRSKSAARERG